MCLLYLGVRKGSCIDSVWPLEYFIGGIHKLPVSAIVVRENILYIANWLNYLLRRGSRRNISFQKWLGAIVNGKKVDNKGSCVLLQ